MNNIKETKKNIESWENEVQEALKNDDIMKAVGCRVLANHLRKSIVEKENYDKLVKRIKELEEENRIFALEGSRVALKLHIEENYIPKQKVKEIIYTIIDYKIPRSTNNGYYYDYFVKQEYKEDFVKLFNKLLEDKQCLKLKRN